jgi:D-amino-acid dehydrogenase
MRLDLLSATILPKTKGEGDMDSLFTIGVIGHASDADLNQLLGQSAIRLNSIAEARENPRIKKAPLLLLDNPAHLQHELDFLRERAMYVAVACDQDDPRQIEQCKAASHALNSKLIVVHTKNGISNEVVRAVEAVALRSVCRDDERVDPVSVAGLKGRPRKSVVLVGAGIVNLIICLSLQKAGFDTHVIDAIPDPRGADIPPDSLGCTYSGGNARMFSFNEARNHNLKFTSDGNLVRFFDSDLQGGGWACGPLSENQAKWSSSFGKSPAWLYGVYDEDIVSFNKVSAPLWSSLMKDHPKLFDSCAVRHDVLRLYSTKPQMEKAIHKEGRLNSIIRQLPLAILASEQPALEPAIAAGNLAGCLEVNGFTLNIHTFAHNIIDQIRENGGVVTFGENCVDVLRDSQGRVNGVKTTNGNRTADHYVFSPGAHGEHILGKLGLPNLMQPVFGAWLQLPMDPRLPLTQGIKLTRSGPLSNGASEGANILPDDNHIWVSSGHGWTSSQPNLIPANERSSLFESVAHTATTLFPQMRDVIKSRIEQMSFIRICTRPWSLGSLGVFSTSPSKTGFVIVATGHNTGGFAQAPAVAEAVVAKLTGSFHSMHVAYHPERALVIPKFFTQKRFQNEC